MASRMSTMNREINEVRNQVGLSTGPVTGWMHDTIEKASGGRVDPTAVADSYFALIGYAQMVADMPTWLGEYSKAMADPANVDEQGLPDEARAIALADQAVLDSQGGGQIKDLAGVQRGGAYLKMWTNFYSFFNVLFNQWAESLEEHAARKRDGYSSTKNAGRLAADYLLLFVFPATLALIIQDAMKGELPDDGEEAFWQWFGANASYLAGTMVGVRELSSTLQGYAGYSGPGGARGFAAAGRLGSQVMQGEADWSLIKAGVEVAGVFLHLPTGQAMRSIEGTAALIEGKTDNPAALVSGAPKQ